MTEAERAAKTAAAEAKRQANREAWARDPRNANVARAAKSPEIAVEVEATPPEPNGSPSLAKLRAIMLDESEPLYRRLDAADVVIDFELAAGGAVNVPPEQIASTALRFYRAVEAAETSVPKALYMRALKAIARIENRRRSVADDDPARQRMLRERACSAINAARRKALAEAGRWPLPEGKYRPLDLNDVWNVPELPDLGKYKPPDALEFGDRLDWLNRVRREHPEAYRAWAAAHEAALLAVKATNRADEWF